jgi:hypothetical protein
VKLKERVVTAMAAERCGQDIQKLHERANLAPEELQG